MKEEGSEFTYTLLKSFSTPAPISALALGHASHIFAGSDDGSLRIYDLSTYKVVKAVRSLGGEVSSIICMKRPGSELRDAWLAHGTQISRFQLDSPKMIQTLEDALKTITVGETEEELVNELALDASKSHLAFGLDSGMVGVLDLATDAVTRMKPKHESVCGCVQFIPDRPRELISAGYDTAILHFDFVQGEVLSDIKMDPEAQSEGMTMAPPFIIGMALSPSGVLAAGTADGRLWISFGGERKSVEGKKKKSKQWGGLNPDETLLIRLAEGPIVSLSFSAPRVLTISTLLGVLTQYELVYNESEGSVLLKQLWQGNVNGLEKVNKLITDEKRIIVGGLAQDGKGVIEIWKREAIPEPPEVQVQA